MGAKSFIIRGLGNAEAFNPCSHGAGRKMSRTKAKTRFSRDDLKAQTRGVECRKDKAVIDEIPGAYKDIEEVMRAQSDLVEVVAELKQVICVKGYSELRLQLKKFEGVTSDLYFALTNVRACANCGGTDKSVVSPKLFLISTLAKMPGELSHACPAG